MKELEVQLQSWAPRPPSARVSRRLFGRTAASAPASPVARETAPFRFGWLAPAAAACLLVCLLFNQHNAPALSGASSSGPIIAMILSNQTGSASTPETLPRRSNSPPADNLGWTNGHVSTSSVGSLSYSRLTN